MKKPSHVQVFVEAEFEEIRHAKIHGKNFSMMEFGIAVGVVWQYGGRRHLHTAERCALFPLQPVQRLFHEGADA